MQVYRFQKKPVDIPRTVVTIGNFDGIHLGHRELISAAVNEAHSVSYTHLTLPTILLV